MASKKDRTAARKKDEAVKATKKAKRINDLIHEGKFDKKAKKI